MNRDPLSPAVSPRLASRCGTTTFPGAVMATALQRLREAAELLPEGKQCRAHAEGAPSGPGGAPRPNGRLPGGLCGLTIGEVAHRYGRAASTVRGWISAGSLPGAYKLRRREWRVPQAALAEFEDAERHARVRHASRQGKNGALGDWRALKDQEVLSP